MQLQLEPERNSALLQELGAFYRRVGLPATLQQLGVGVGALAGAARQIAEVTVRESPHLKHFRRVLTAAELAEAMIALSTAQAADA